MTINGALFDAEVLPTLTKINPVTAPFGTCALICCMVATKAVGSMVPLVAFVAPNRTVVDPETKPVPRMVTASLVVPSGGEKESTVTADTEATPAASRSALCTRTHLKFIVTYNGFC